MFRYDDVDPASDWKNYHGDVVTTFLTPKCVYWEEEGQRWKRDGLTVDELLIQSVGINYLYFN